MARRKTTKTRKTRQTSATDAQDAGPEAQVAAAAAPENVVMVFATPQEEIAHLFAHPGKTPEEIAANHARVTQLLEATRAPKPAREPARRASSSQNGANAVNAPLCVEEHKKYLIV